MTDSVAPLFDWRSEWLSYHRGEHVALLIPIAGELLDEGADDLYKAVQQELRDLLDEPTLAAEQVDPYTGAGGYGLATIWEIVGHGADLFAWVSAAIVAAKQIRTVAKFLANRIGGGEEAAVYLSGEAIKALCVAELCESGIDPRTIQRVTLVEHKYNPAEPTVEKQQFFSAYTVTVEGGQPDSFYHVWNFFVTCRGEIVSRGEAKIPMPNASQWFQANPPTDKLSGIP